MNRRALLPFVLCLGSVAVADAAGVRRPPARRPAAPSSSAAPAPALTAAEAQAVVDAHDAVRAQVGVGPLTWDANLAKAAQQYVQTLTASCTIAHSNLPYGENLAAWTGAGPPAKAVTLWAQEKASYGGGGGPYAGSSDGAGHYTQVVWRATTRVGCGRVTCTRQGMQWTLVACEYDPRGNVLGEPVY
jgi:pathogenesis-related protein 1